MNYDLKDMIECAKKACELFDEKNRVSNVGTSDYKNE